MNIGFVSSESEWNSLIIRSGLSLELVTEVESQESIEARNNVSV